MLKTIHMMLTRLGPGAAERPQDYVALWRRVKVRIDAEVPDVDWRMSYAVGGGWDYVDVLETPDTESALKVAALIRTLAGAEVELWPATPWPRFKHLVAPHREVDVVQEAGAGSFPASDAPAFSQMITGTHATSPGPT